jgi:hypothetical protein
VDPIDIPFLEQTAQLERLSRHPEPQRIERHIRNLRRLLLYETFGARAFVATDGKPVWYVQPSIQEPIDPSNERELILMWMPLKPGSRPIRPTVAFDFIYDDLYLEAFAGSGPVQIEGFVEHLADVKRRVISRLPADCRLGPVARNGTIRGLPLRAKRENFGSQSFL